MTDLGVFICFGVAFLAIFVWGLWLIALTRDSNNTVNRFDRLERRVKDLESTLQALEQFVTTVDSGVPMPKGWSLPERPRSELYIPEGWRK